MTCKYHCKCMNLDKQCPNPHYMDANCTCAKPQDYRNDFNQRITDAINKPETMIQTFGDKVGAYIIFENGDEYKDRVNEYLLKYIGLSEVDAKAIMDMPPEEREKIKKISRISSLKSEIKRLEDEIQ